MAWCEYGSEFDKKEGEYGVCCLREEYPRISPLWHFSKKKGAPTCYLKCCQGPALNHHNIILSFTFQPLMVLLCTPQLTLLSSWKRHQFVNTTADRLTFLPHFMSLVWLSENSPLNLVTHGWKDSFYKVLILKAQNCFFLR